MTIEHLDLETLSAFADGDLNAVAAQRVERHIAECGECRRSLERVRALVAAAGALPRDVAPPPEVWSGIRNQVTGHRSLVTKRWWHNGWLAAAAGLVLVVGTASLMLVMASNGKPKASNVASVTSGRVPAILASVEKNYSPTLTELRATFESQRSRLAPSTVRTMDHSLAVIDSAIAEARDALSKDPASASLMEMLSGYYQRKVEFLKRANTVSSSL